MASFVAAWRAGEAAALFSGGVAGTNLWKVRSVFVGRASCAKRGAHSMEVSRSDAQLNQIRNGLEDSIINVPFDQDYECALLLKSEYYGSNAPLSGQRK